MTMRLSRILVHEDNLLRKVVRDVDRARSVTFDLSNCSICWCIALDVDVA